MQYLLLLLESRKLDRMQHPPVQALRRVRLVGVVGRAQAQRLLLVLLVRLSGDERGYSTCP